MEDFLIFLMYLIIADKKLYKSGVIKSIVVLGPLVKLPEEDAQQLQLARRIGGRNN